MVNGQVSQGSLHREPGRVVGRNAWREVIPRRTGVRPSDPLKATIVIPAQNSSSELEHTLAALACQDYPLELLEVIVADDRSDPPIQLPALRPPHTRVITVDASGHGSGLARDAGARVATGDFILFLDSDIIADRSHVDAHARWHEVLSDAVVLGTRDFIDPVGLDVSETVEAVRGGDLSRLLPDRERTPHAWIDRIFEGTEDLNIDRDDLWRPVVGASVSVRTDFYLETGGFAAFERWGIVDIEFGYRAFTAGGVVIPERAAYSLHQGPRTASIRGPELIAARAPLIANHIAHGRYRPSVPGRRWVVPEIHVTVDSRGVDFRTTQRTVEDLLVGDATDLTVAIFLDTDASPEDRGRVLDYWAADDRVKVVAEPARTGFPSPYTVAVRAGTRFGPQSLSMLRRMLMAWDVGLVTVELPGETVVEAWTTRALHRSIRAVTIAGHSSIRAAVRELFGESLVAGPSLGIGREGGGSERYLRDDLFFPIKV